MQKETLISIGNGNFVIASRVVAILNPAFSPMRRLREDAKNDSRLIDATQGKKTRAIIVLDSNHVLLSSVLILLLHLLRHQDCLSQRPELVIDLLQLILLVALCHHAAASLKPQLAVAAHEGSDGYSLVEAAVEPDETYEIGRAHV